MCLIDGGKTPKLVRSEEKSPKCPKWYENYSSKCGDSWVHFCIWWCKSCFSARRSGFHNKQNIKGPNCVWPYQDSAASDKVSGRLQDRRNLINNDHLKDYCMWPIKQFGVTENENISKKGNWRRECNSTYGTVGRSAGWTLVRVVQTLIVNVLLEPRISKHALQEYSLWTTRS